MRNDLRIAFHCFLAFFILCYLFKGVAFLLSDAPEFSLINHLPNKEVMNVYIMMAMAIAIIFSAVYATAYRYTRTFLNRFAGHEQPRDHYALFKFSALFIISVFIFINKSTILTLLSGDFSILIRRSLDPSLASSGLLGFYSALTNLVIGAATCLIYYALRNRRWALFAYCIFFFMTNAALSSGSRFTLITSLLMPVLCVFIVLVKDKKIAKATPPLVYLSVFLLPLIVAPLLIIRTNAGMSLSNILTYAYVSFDALDHFLNYLYLWPQDFPNFRYSEDVLQIVPRLIFPEKPRVYGALALQDVIYPYTVGGALSVSDELIIGHYPLSILVMSLDFYGPFGLIFFAIATGAFIAFLDFAANSRSILLNAFFSIAFFSIYHIIRSGIFIYLVQSIAFLFVPIMLQLFLVKAPRLLKARPLNKGLR